MSKLNRREVIAAGTATAALQALTARLAAAAPTPPGETILPWLDRPAPNPVPEVVRNQLVWEEVEDWITPNDKFFSIVHFDLPAIAEENWRLEVDGLVTNPLSLTLSELKAMPKQEVVFTIECSGNHGLPFLDGAIGNARWAGTPLAPLLRAAGVKPEGIEVVFWGADAGDIELKDMFRDVKMHQNFARSLALADALDPGLLLCYEMNGSPLPAANGYPLRLIAPGYYGIANVKWLQRIEIRSSRFMGLFMARNYVTIREEEHDGKTVWTESSVGRAMLKSVPVRVTRNQTGLRIAVAAWGAAIARVEVRIDDGPWQEAAIAHGETAEFAWQFWSLDWPQAPAGEHAITSRAIDTAGNVQPAMDDPLIARKHTFWESNGQVTRKVAV
jgi:DMSO/TMAO reductase YedYZ molybdopterin-dependent catalytic subunit